MRSQMSSTLTIRKMTMDDIDATMRIQIECYSADLIEPKSLVTSRLQASPNHCYVCCDETNEPCAYMFAYMSKKGKVTPLEGEFVTPIGSDCIYLHDMAVSKSVSGRGVASKLARTLLNNSKDFGAVSAGLVSVQGSVPFWSKLGYVPMNLTDEEQIAHLDSYGVPAVYMFQILGSNPTSKL